MSNRIDGRAHEAEDALEGTSYETQQDRAQRIERIERPLGKAEQMIALINDRLVRKPARR
jgi:hypothetical protein